MGSIFRLLRLLLVLLPLGAATEARGWWWQGEIVGQGPIRRESRPLTACHAVQVEGDFTVVLDPTGDPGLVVSAQANLLPHVQTTLSQGELRIRADRNLDPARSVEILVRGVSPRQLELTGSGSLRTRQPLTVPKLEVSLTGTGEIVLEVVSRALHTELAGSGRIRLSGQTENHHVTLAGSGEVQALALASHQACVDVIGSGRVSLEVGGNLEVSLLGSGEVRYQGSPHVRKTILGSGSVQALRPES